LIDNDFLTLMERELTQSLRKMDYLCTRKKKIIKKYEKI